MAGQARTPEKNPCEANERWAHQQRLQESSKHFEDASHNWDDPANAKRYAENSRGEYDDRVQTTIAGLALNKNMRVLDIGAGPGTLAIPIAPRVKDVTAIEPGAGMAAVLREQCRAKGIANVSCIKKLWEDIDPARDLDGKYDLVIASLSLTMQDIRAALLKMDAVANGEVCLYWFVDMPFWEKMYVELWEPLHGCTYYPGPKTDCLFEVLYNAGIYADVKMMPLSKEYRFGSRDEMTAFFRGRFRVTTAAQEKILDAYLARLVQEKNGEVVVSGRSTYAKVSWKATGRSG
ncbi:class I SAM-dependent methyltransferase [Methanoregula sp. UBA64]|jgi:SAM-dependent methyltransferase|uniref:class I SAM-dependent methyltransferase n=1 Tax=Methanoregula sp. UBA64 TaxID=1915554 RepID=UPI0025F5AD11|nr:class I SAM-dependent methyltransferase [Methanoregula sp. UBA64]